MSLRSTTFRLCLTNSVAAQESIIISKVTALIFTLALLKKHLYHEGPQLLGELHDMTFESAEFASYFTMLSYKILYFQLCGTVSTGRMT